MFRNGIYKICYGAPDADGSNAEHALAVMRDGKLIGADRHGGVFHGEPLCRAGPLETIRLQLTVPPGGELVSGYRAGPEGASLTLRGQFDPACDRQTGTIDVAGQRVEVQVNYLGPLPE